MATIEAATAVELAGRLALMSARVSPRELGRSCALGWIVRLLDHKDMLDRSETLQLRKLVYMENAAVHEGKTHSRMEVLQILKIARATVEKLQRVH